MNPDQVELYRALFAGSRLDDDLADFAVALGTAPQPAGGLLLVGTPDEEPWHFAAHLTDEAEWSSRPELSPTLVRWVVPDGSPRHLAVGLDRLDAVRRRETLLVVAPDATPERLLEQLADARRGGAMVLAIETGDDDLRSIATESLRVPNEGDSQVLDVVQHVVSATAPSARANPKGMRRTLARLLDRAQGNPSSPPPFGWR